LFPDRGQENYNYSGKYFGVGIGIRAIFQRLRLPKIRKPVIKLAKDIPDEYKTEVELER
jgi:hypothetical protein